MEDTRKKIIISPWSKKMRNNKENPKNYPFWNDVTLALKPTRYLIQVGTKGEKLLNNIDEVQMDLPLSQLALLLKRCDGFACVDNFFNHFATFYKKRGVVIFGRSDPNIFGYDQNINLLKDRKYLRPRQFEMWEQDIFVKEAFIEPAIVISSIERLLGT